MNKTVLITGASSGIGLSCANIFAKNGYNVIINYLKREEEALNLKKELEKQFNIKCLTIKANIKNEEEVKQMFLKIKKEFGSISCLVNNAGIAKDNSFLDKSVSEFRKVLDVNLIGTYLVTKYASLIMEEGSIINIASTNAIDTNYIESIDYDASKAGILSLTKNFADYLAPKIRVNAVLPGWVNTNMTKDLNEDFRKKEEEKILLKRFANPKEIAEVVYFLASPKASYINKSFIRVDGGTK